MKINLKELAQNRERLRYGIQVLGYQSVSKPIANKLKKLERLLEEIETDLELGGECVIELDKPRLEAIEEKNKMMKFLEGDEP